MRDYHDNLLLQDFEFVCDVDVEYSVYPKEDYAFQIDAVYLVMYHESWIKGEKVKHTTRTNITDQLSDRQLDDIADEIRDNLEVER